MEDFISIFLSNFNWIALFFGVILVIKYLFYFYDCSLYDINGKKMPGTPNALFHQSIYSILRKGRTAKKVISILLI